MPGRYFVPSSEPGPFVGLIFISSSRGVSTLPGRIMSQVQAGASVMRASGRSFNGHTALMAGNEGKIETIVGWDPESAVTAMVQSSLHGYEGMSPLRGEWGDDVGMDADNTARYFGVPVNLGRYHQFCTFIDGLKGRNDFGAVSEEAGCGFSYAFKPHHHQQKMMEADPSSADSVANCGDAAFHVLATFLYEWGMKHYVDELRAYILQDEKTMNFSQGKLMGWATPPG